MVPQLCSQGFNELQREEHFSKIPERSFYHNKYLFTRSLRQIYDNRIDEAISDLKIIIGRLDNGDRLKDDARKTLARLYYEKGQFAKADFLYQQIEMDIVEQSQTLMKRAWAHYRMGNPERAMGLLYSFEAPSYVNAFTPEFYIGKSFIYKDVCHYQTAMAELYIEKSRLVYFLRRSQIDIMFERPAPCDVGYAVKPIKVITAKSHNQGVRP